MDLKNYNDRCQLAKFIPLICQVTPHYHIDNLDPLGYYISNIIIHKKHKNNRPQQRNLTGKNHQLFQFCGNLFLWTIINYKANLRLNEQFLPFYF